MKEDKYVALVRENKTCRSFLIILKNIIKTKDRVKVAMFCTHLFKKKEWKHSIRYYTDIDINDGNILEI